MLKVTVSTSSSATILNLEGKLSGPWVEELRECWRTTDVPKGSVRIMLCAVTFIDENGKRLLAEMHREGAELVAEGCMNTAIVAEIMHEELT